MMNLDPILTLHLPKAQSTKVELGVVTNTSSVSSVCFLGRTSASAGQCAADAGDENDSNSDNEGVVFRCKDLAAVRSSRTPLSAETVASMELQGYGLASCHPHGAFIWDLAERKSVQQFSDRGPGLSLRRVDDQGCRILYHSRDAAGTVSLHDVAHDGSLAVRVQPAHRVETFSRTFCAASPCIGDGNLVALPCEDDTAATVRDWRMPDTSTPLATCFPSIELANRKHGMLTSLAMSVTGSMGRPLLCCGMESGQLFFYDLANPKQALPIDSYQLSKEPVLSLDVHSSILPLSSNLQGSVVVVVGLAGSAEQILELPESDRGTVCVLKASLDQDYNLQTRLRSRFGTCNISDSTMAGKPGVQVCRFRPDGRIFAVGGWDSRLRLFDRTASSKPLAILRGHTSSVSAVDWAPDAARTGFIATGASDGRINIWRCFPASLKGREQYTTSANVQLD